MRRIAIVGTASSASTGPYADASWEIWGVSARGDYVTRADRWFEIHRLDGEPEDWANLWRKTLKEFSHDISVLYMLYPEADLAPNVQSYPYERIVQRFGTRFMSSTFSWMMAMAIDELRPKDGKPVEGEIGIWGVDMEHGSEYADQRAGFFHFIELAGFVGIKVSHFANSGLSYQPVPYPFWQDDPLLSKLTQRHEESMSRLKELDETIRHTRTMMAQNTAVIEELTRVGKQGKRIAALQKELDGLLQTSSMLSKEHVYREAAAQEQTYFLNYLKQ